MHKRVAVFIDGSNFYFKMKDLRLRDLFQFNFSQFIQYLAQGDQVVKATYYIGKVRTDGTSKVQNLFDQQRKLLAYLKKHNVKYSLGYLLKSDEKFHEKGVDVNMAVDILVSAYEDMCDKIIIVSSDTDLLPAIKKVKEKGKAVEYIGFSHQPSLALVANCNSSRLFTKVELKKFIS
jgi:uncharacterized LabA/DUF88 family protein